MREVVAYRVVTVLWSIVRVKQRLLALFLLAVLVASLSLQGVVAYAQSTLTASNTLPKITNAPRVVPASSKLATDAARMQSPESKLSVGVPAQNGEMLQGNRKPAPTSFTPHELVEKRTATSDVRLNKDGTYSLRQYTAPHYYKVNDKWQPIDTSLIEDTNADDSGNIFGQALSRIGSLFSEPKAFIVKDNDWLARFAPSDFNKGMVRIEQKGKQIGFTPIGANTVNPVITTDKNNRQTVHYYSIWPNVDLEYQVSSSEIKEYVVLKNNNAPTSFKFKMIGASLASHNGDGQTYFTMDNALDGGFSIAALSLVLNNFGPETNQNASGLSQSYANGTLTVSLLSDYLKTLPAKAFPAVIDPSTQHSVLGPTRDSGNYVSFKSDGYVCASNVCNPQAGSLQDSSYIWRSWRSAFYGSYSSVQGNVFMHANLHITRRTGVTFYTGDSNGHWFKVWHAACNNGYNCMDGNLPTASAWFGDVADIDVTSIYQALINRGDWGGWLGLTGEEVAANTYKNFDPDPNYTYLDFTYNRVPPAPTVMLPSEDNQVYTDPQISLQVSSVSDADGDPVQYYFRIATGSDGETGTVINSGNVSSTQWTVPDGVLQDGMTYYLHTYSFDGTNYSSPSAVRPFKIDMRRGKDKTQTYDTVGSVSVDLATGNLSTSATSHTSTALGGSLGLSLDYNSPLRSRNGLVGEYWNLPANYPGGTPTGTPDLVRVDKNIDFNWNTGSPSGGIINSDWFYGRWTGYFVAPVTGTYYFGGSNDDSLTVWVNNAQVYGSGGCYSGVCYGSAVTLTAGQVAPFRAEFEEATGPAYARLFVKGAVAEQIVPQGWLQTGPRSIAQKNGLTGYYYSDDGSHNLDATNKQLFLSRTDPAISFNWGSSAPVPGGSADFMARWNGYITISQNDTYQFGTNADDGARIKINGNTVLDAWGSPCCTLRYGPSIALTPGIYPITIDYYDAGGPASLYMYVKGAVTSEQVVPSSWLSPKAQVLPDGWNLGIDPDGNLSYDHLVANQSTTTLTDSTGDTHIYTWTGSGYKPPVNEDGQLTRSADGTFTLDDVDGRTYIFGADGILTSVTTPIDDRHPAALHYDYQGSPAKISQITDGVDSSRYARIYYSGAPECGTAPATYDANAPVGMLCALKTNDGRVTYFYYSSGYLSLIAKPGNDMTTYQYDSLGRIVAIRDSRANDAVAAGVRADDATTFTQIAYDALGRASSVTAPAATGGAAQQQKAYSYLPITNFGWSQPQVITGDVMPSSISLLNWGPNKLALFARNSANNAVVRFGIDGVWGDWQNLGGGIYDEPHATSWQDGRIDMFVRGTDNNLYTKTYLNGAWGDYYNIGAGSITSAPQATSWGTGRIDVVAKGPNNELLHRWYSTATGWSGAYDNLSGCLSQGPTVSTWGFDRLNIYLQGCGSPNNFFSQYWSPGWSGFSVLTNELNISTAPQSVTTSSRQIHVVARGSTGALRYLYYNGTNWEDWQTLQSCINGSPAITQDGDSIDVAYVGCDGTVYQTRRSFTGSTLVHIAGAAEPNGYSEKVEFDDLYRTTKTTDVAGLTTATEWNTVKDISYSTADATGLKSTTVYDADSRPVSQYGPAPSAWFASDRTPLSQYASQVPHTDTAYDEGITGPATEYMTVSTPPINNTLANNRALSPGQNLLSADHRFNFIYQTDGNIVLYGPNGVMWASNTGGKASTILVMQTDGNLVLYNNSTPVWASGTGGGNTSYLVIQNDGNAVIYNSVSAQWASNTGGWSAVNYGFSDLTGAPLVHATNIGGDASQVSREFGTGSPALGVSSTSWGLRLTGKLALPIAGSWGMRIWSDNGVRVWIDDQLVMNDWYDGGQRNHPAFTFNNATAGSWHRVRIEYYHLSGDANLSLYMTPPGLSETQTVAHYFKPDYSLATSTTTYDSQLGNMTSKTSYGSNPEFGLASSVSIDPNGLNLTVSSTYEAPGTGGFLRQLSKTLPGGATTSYAYYGSSDTVDNPCTQTVEAYHEGGMLRLKTEPDPDGAGPQTGRTTETIYDDAGNVVASRYNQDPWTCTTYDARSRAVTTVVPSYNGQPGRTITNNYAVNGNPLITATADDKGTITSENDLLGRNVTYTDARGNVTTSAYDDLGRLTSRTSPLGREDFTYNGYNLLTDQKLDSVLFAHMTYDSYNRMSAVDYPNGQHLALSRDTLGRLSNRTYTLASGQTLSDQVTRATTGDILKGTELGQAKSYTYDSVGRLTAATVAGNTYTYGYGVQDASCAAGTNSNAGKDSNRTTQTINGVTTTYCYDFADRLVSSSNASYDAAQYDSHGNITRLGSGTTITTMSNDSSDRNIGISEQLSGHNVTYTRDVQSRLLSRHEDTNGSNSRDDYYGYTASGDTPDFVTDSTNHVTQKYLQLAGDVLLTVRPDSQSASVQTYSLPNIHGDVFATVDADGNLTGTFQTGPFGEESSQAAPGNALGVGAFQYLGQHEKLTEGTFTIQPTQMGARVYIAGIGRFLQVDPVEGGTPNNYIYPPDPVNYSDLDGSMSWKNVWDALNMPVIEYPVIGKPLNTLYTWEDAHPRLTFVIMNLTPGGDEKVSLDEKPMESPIRGYTRHGLNQAISRDEHGVSVRAINDAVRNPVKTIKQAGDRVMYRGNDATVILNKARQVITTWAHNIRGWRW